MALPFLRKKSEDNQRPKRYDGVIEAVRYDASGRIALARVHERRGLVFSDHVLLTREELIHRLKAGQVFVTGRRKPYLGNAFEVYEVVRLAGTPGQEVVISGPANGSERDHLNVPLF
ncbi:hypothetical protein [uncultured Thermanaerothrix sp.]|uniref:hypothetical protein n=1 Tax=uncultured Thermanaerothrix sp. TaxID=1195149 RepID=UPI002624A787|nr:hypothetical protein [uncultured Thermanaerothrix sp.]